ncbi:hypothetical protein [Catenuloplanes japonicus]|uniref:hypothetical protein n=1 Tax=Catenuloplanes japonicus TaxID=33876 RepID=UPI00052621E7|nr:hypothetical protein [Catenuloplanes japonicus]
MTRLAAVTAVAGLALLLTACSSPDSGTSSGDGGSADVATLTTDTPAATSSPAPPERPLERADASQEDIARMYAVFDECMEQNGFPQPDGTGTLDQQAAALKVCGHLQPETLSKRAERTDPHFADHHRDWITCIRAKGIDAWGEPGELFVEEMLSEADAKLVGECEMKAFTTTLTESS